MTGVSDTCAVTKRWELGFRPQLCGKPAKGTLKDGTVACGVHIGAEKRSVTNQERSRAEAAARNERSKTAARKCAQINAAGADLQARTYSRANGGTDPDYVVVRTDALLVALGRRAESGSE